MITTLERFKNHFRKFEDQYIIIGGTACDLLMEDVGLPFRATKDLDIVLIIETVTNEFAKQFWEYVIEAKYQHMNRSTGKTQFYRFTSPETKEYPFMIEIFSRKPETVILAEDSILTPLPFDDEISSLSAILIDDAYYELLKSGQNILDGISILDEYCLIPFKAKAWLDLRERKSQGDPVDSKNIKKHKNDVFRLAQLLAPNKRKKLGVSIKQDLKLFLVAMEKEEIDLKALNIRNLTKENILEMLYQCYEIE
ncbi:MAG: hypothetical protein Q4D77_04775 [Peptostreptococcaceae bacterium]|nr:hypothetical protein [Peptostreptococcaceae bacterium]